MSREKIINVAVIAHVDAGKSTLVDAFLAQSGVFRENEEVVDCIMDSNDLERERGITIYSKNCAIQYEDLKINIVDTPGHADFSSEVERIMRTVDTSILLVDSSEGPMPQTRFVLQKSLEMGHRPILFINKIDKKDARAEEVVDMTFDLFADLNASDEQLDFPIVYGIAREGIAKRSLEEESDSLKPLFELLLDHVKPYPDKSNEPLQLQISSLDYDEYIGRLGIGRVLSGQLKKGSPFSVCKRDGQVLSGKSGKIFAYSGIGRIEKNQIESGDIAIISGISDISIGETLCAEDAVRPLPMIQIEEPTLAMNFYVNDAPFCGQSGKFLTTRHIKARLERELETNVGLRVEEMEGKDGFKVSGRGELHLSILLERMRREGYELSVSKPEVLFKMVEGKKYEPFEKVILTLPDEYAGTAIASLNQRKGMMVSMSAENGYTKIEYSAPTRGLLGYRSQFINETRGEGTLIRSFAEFLPYCGEIPGRQRGVLVSQEQGTAMAYSLYCLSERADMFIKPATAVYEGMIVGLNSRREDMTVNVCKNKKLTNIRASGSDDAIKLPPIQAFSLEEALEFIDADELVEITPTDIRLRKKIRNANDRIKYMKKNA